MTRPMTNAQLSLMAVPIDRRLRNDSLVWFLTDSAVFGAGIGIVIATIILLSDTFGLFTLIRSQSNSIPTAFAFILSGAMIFAPISLAVAVGLAARARQVFSRVRFSASYRLSPIPAGADWGRP
jgi:hypothetical protein